MKILVTGASGFIGSFIIGEGLQRGHEMWAGVRRSSSRQYLQYPRTRFAELDLSDTGRLTAQLLALKAGMGDAGWDYVIHAAGATKSLHREGFFRTNTEGTQHLVEALRAADMMPRRLVFISSLSVFGAIKETENPGNAQTDTSGSSMLTSQLYPSITAEDAPQPNTAYGESKLAAERWLQTQTDVPWVILRPTGVYGPRERDYFLMAQSIKQHVDFAVGYKPQEITFVYVKDVVQAVFLACERPGAAVLHHAYFLSDGRSYNSRAFSDLLQKEMGVRHVLHIKAPLWFLRAVCAVNGTVCRWMGKLTTLNMDKYHILSQRNWNCDIGPARSELGFDPQWPLERGVPETVAWYKQEGWL
ncbi:MAG: NAD(P)-dependent oxidoreductase [Bacteroidaceae bacterium]|nr:NAD(P)-dependent oxidoreductase [Bacteroidaceae bacterium]